MNTLAKKKFDILTNGLMVTALNQKLTQRFSQTCCKRIFRTRMGISKREEI